jgi:hypothetical protein
MSQNRGVWGSPWYFLQKKAFAVQIQGIAAQLPQNQGVAHNSKAPVTGGLAPNFHSLALILLSKPLSSEACALFDKKYRVGVQHHYPG